MGASSLAAGALRTLTDEEENSATDLMFNFNLLRTAFNASLETSTGHEHDSVDSAGITSGITGFDFEDAFLYMQGQFGKGGL